VNRSDTAVTFCFQDNTASDGERAFYHFKLSPGKTENLHPRPP